ncbi:MAG TPA: ATP-dependent helicase HrpB [Spirochaetota bacterium]|nr:ATP-dependent helicase HrpB [Spirochaetota bacterium]HOD13994.1 ATP-dependent helicase HrpB [Spirochaetota bacterium]HPN13265.1 ATP-dependent helicase HrpB [Spirochaetota bacterium]HQL80884.1 ATP-dependent helicase HrpB [Spirochaetota bacterium]
MRSIDDILSLPVYAQLDEIAGSLAASGTLILHAETGAGKTTLVPWRLLSHDAFTGSRLILLQPRRIAARAAAERIADLLGEKIGQTVGLRTRQETIIGKTTRLEVMTEGVLTRIMQKDQSLDNYGTIIFDEFHERNLQSDLGLALAWDCRETLRPGLKILFMSATPPADEVRSAYGKIPLVSVPGRAHPVRVEYRPPHAGEKPWEGAARLAMEAITILMPSEGDILVFLPGFREIHRTREILQQYADHNVKVVVLHGRITPEEQRAVLLPIPGSGRRIILSTNVAETSVTVPGVRAVVDIGLERRVRYRARTGMDHWDTVEISIASAEQRKGRAGRLGPGICLRWWNQTNRREKFSPPEIAESDLAPLVLETALWGTVSPYELKWLTTPPQASVDRASELLGQLSLIDDRGRITEAGRSVAILGLHPRLGHMLQVAAGKGWLATAAVTAAIIEEGDTGRNDGHDFRDRLSAIALWIDNKQGSIRESLAHRILNESLRILRICSGGDNYLTAADIDQDLAGTLLAMAYPDRIAQKTSSDNNESRWILASGRAARLIGPLSREEFISIADLDGGETDARIFLAAPLNKEDIIHGLAGKPGEELITEWDGWTPKSRLILRLGRLLLKERYITQLPKDKAITIAYNRIMLEGLDCLPWNKSSLKYLARCRFIQKFGGQNNWPDFKSQTLINEIETWLLPNGNYNGGPIFQEQKIVSALENRLGWNRVNSLNKLAPEHYTLPSGTRKLIDYENGEIPVIAARIQEFFGSTETPQLCGIPCILHLLNPAGRLIQITRDLKGFWERSYKDVKKEQMGRYPRHYWPDNPQAAVPTAKAKPRK